MFIIIIWQAVRYITVFPLSPISLSPVNQNHTFKTSAVPSLIYWNRSNQDRYDFWCYSLGLPLSTLTVLTKKLWKMYLLMLFTQANKILNLVAALGKISILGRVEQKLLHHVKLLICGHICLWKLIYNWVGSEEVVREENFSFTILGSVHGGL